MCLICKQMFSNEAMNEGMKEYLRQKHSEKVVKSADLHPPTLSEVISWTGDGQGGEGSLPVSAIIEQMTRSSGSVWCRSPHTLNAPQTLDHRTHRRKGRWQTERASNRQVHSNFQTDMRTKKI